MHELSHAQLAQSFHLLHQISLACEWLTAFLPLLTRHRLSLCSTAYDGRTMHGGGFLLGLAALNFGEVDRSLLSRDQWAEMLFAMGVQFQFSCACIAPTLAVSHRSDLVLTLPLPPLPPSALLLLVRWVGRGIAVMVQRS